ncbi:MAG: NAD(P)-dependent glycerol-3-phosphate dehydrogenase [Alphaproteobacteria bacterium]|nr:NAD(P)-dependent glycerol-3-phosphate dehydrogenase [Alphaproteobacteria bacterium]
MQNIGVIGTGIWGTALALTATRAGNNVLCWAREPEVVESINYTHVNKLFLPDIPLPDSIKATPNMAEVFDFADIILLTVSAQYTRITMQQIKPYIKNSTVLVLCAKGIEQSSGQMLSEIAAEEIPEAQIAVLSGPGFAIDVAKQKIASVTIGCEKEKIAEHLVKTLGTACFRPYLTTDIVAPLVGGSVKNVIAIASGIVEGAALGDGARAALITRGFHEMARFAAALGGDLEAIMGMCGLGDLVLTASCSQSRNFSFGYAVGACGSAKKLIAENTRTVEGIYTAKAVVKRARELNIEMPICEMVNRLLFEGISLQDAMKELLSRPYKGEGF